MDFTLDRVILHTFVHDSSNRALPTCQISLKLKKIFVAGQMYVQMDGHLRPALLGRLCRRVHLKTGHVTLTTPIRGVICHRKPST